MGSDRGVRGSVIPNLPNAPGQTLPAVLTSQGQSDSVGVLQKLSLEDRATLLPAIQDGTLSSQL